MRPVNFISLTDLHTNTVLPIIRRCVHGFILIKEFALVSLASFSCKSTAVFYWCWTCSCLIELSERIMLGSKMPVNVDWTQAFCVIRNFDWFVICVKVSIVSLCNVDTSLSTYTFCNVNAIISKAIDILKSWITFTRTDVYACWWFSGGENETWCHVSTLFTLFGDTRRLFKLFLALTLLACLFTTFLQNPSFGIIASDRSGNGSSNITTAQQENDRELHDQYYFVLI
mmetsp:Transcript_43635/g.49495  ORF Transcript_43635/g.49495 Transcript_43635/m.49495 type:complete len:228 (-) Transcript_43635:42-725(-)